LVYSEIVLSPRKKLAALKKAGERKQKQAQKKLLQQGKEQGLTQGLKAKALEIAARMVLQELSLDFVEEMTGVSKLQLNRLKFPKEVL